MKKISFMLLVILFIMTGCSSAPPKVTTLQRSQMRTQTLDAEYKVTFKSAMIVLENQGYTIENTDMESGLIKAIVAKDATTGFAKAFGAYGVITYNVSCTVSKASEESTRIRFNIRKEEDRQQGMYSMKEAEEIDDPVIYNSLFNDLKLEIERMKAIS